MAKDFIVKDIDVKCMCGKHPSEGSVARSKTLQVTIAGDRQDVHWVVKFLEDLPSRQEPSPRCCYLHGLEFTPTFAVDRGIVLYCSKGCELSSPLSIPG